MPRHDNNNNNYYYYYYYPDIKSTEHQQLRNSGVHTFAATRRTHTQRVERHNTFAR